MGAGTRTGWVIFPPLGPHPSIAATCPARFRAIVRMPLWLVLLAALPVRGQGPGDNRRMRTVVLTGDTIALDTLGIAPGSLSLWHGTVRLPDSAFVLDPYRARLWVAPGIAGDTLTARYRVWPLLFAAERRHKDRTRLLSEDPDRRDPFKYVAPAEREDLFGNAGLNKSGSISRGILFGNNQDLSVNSSLNLELSGRITDRIQVQASITDNSIPIQAEGNTLELQDFDQVFIKLFEDDWELIAGDFVLQRPNSHFLTYLKKSKGLSFNHRARGARATNTLGTSVAISKGKFARNVIQGVEGVQGPYRLRGDGGETFIVVLSGTERVFIDGQQLVRGQENDYVIDYNTAELTFTARRLITKDRRITVEFQYSDRNYMRTLLRLDDTWTRGRTTLRLNVFSEQDHKGQPLQQDLTDQEQRALAEAGDDPLAAVVPGVDTVAYNPDQVLYKAVDSLGYSPVYVYSTSPDSARHRITFSAVGAGKGDYVQQEFTPNGRVYRWVAPDTVNGAVVHRGDHAPVRVLVAPRSQQVVTVGADHRTVGGLRLSTELAYGRYDRNTFSGRDAADDQAFAARVKADQAIPLRAADSTWALELGLESEALTASFTPVERYRAVEFERNWNAVGRPLDGDQLLAALGVGLRAGKAGRLRYVLNTFQVRDRYAGWRHELLSDLHPGRFDLTGTASLLTTTSPVRTGFLRHKARLARRMRWFTIGVQDEHEHNRFLADTSDALLAGSYRFHDWEVFIQSRDTARTTFRVGGGQRYDQGLRDGGLARSTVATVGTATLGVGRDARHRLATTFTYRQLRIVDSTLTAQRPEDTYLMRIDHDLTLGKGVAVWDLFYELGSGLEQQREFLYVEVPAGQGLYIWNDYNGNGIKELNEFEQANFGYEANYVRVFVPGTTYARTFSNQLSASLDLRPSVAWGGRTGLRRFLAKFSDLASFRSDRKTSTADLGQALDPFRIDPTDTLLTAFTSSLRNTLFYDRTSPVWSVDHTFQSDRTKTLLLNGFESRLRELDQVRIRWNITRQWTTDLEGEAGRVANASDLLSGRTFNIRQYGVRPRVTWRPNTDLRAALSYRYTDKLNREELGGEAATVQNLGLEARWNTAGKGSIQLNLDLVDIRYDGDPNTSLGNEMLGGLKVGTNWTWSLNIQRRLSRNLQVDLTYNGRKSEHTPAVHVGGAQVRAFF